MTREHKPGDRKERASQWFAELRDRICAAFEKLEDEYDGEFDGRFAGRPAGRFERSSWKRPTEEGSEGGGGTMSVMRGRVLDRKSVV